MMQLKDVESRDKLETERVKRQLSTEGAAAAVFPQRKSHGLPVSSGSAEEQAELMKKSMARKAESIAQKRDKEMEQLRGTCTRLRGHRNELQDVAHDNATDGDCATIQERIFYRVYVSLLLPVW